MKKSRRNWRRKLWVNSDRRRKKGMDFLLWMHNNGFLNTMLGHLLSLAPYIIQFFHLLSFMIRFFTKFFKSQSTHRPNCEGIQVRMVCCNAWCYTLYNRWLGLHEFYLSKSLDGIEKLNTILFSQETTKNSNSGFLILLLNNAIYQFLVVFIINVEIQVFLSSTLTIQF